MAPLASWSLRHLAGTRSTQSMSAIADATGWSGCCHQDHASRPASHSCPFASPIPRSWLARFGLAGHTSFLEPGSIVFGGITCECCTWGQGAMGGRAGIVGHLGWLCMAQLHGGALTQPVHSAHLRFSATTAGPAALDNGYIIADSVALATAFFESRLRGDRCVAGETSASLEAQCLLPCIVATAHSCSCAALVWCRAQEPAVC